MNQNTQVLLLESHFLLAHTLLLTFRGLWGLESGYGSIQRRAVGPEDSQLCLVERLPQESH